MADSLEPSSASFANVGVRHRLGGRAKVRLLTDDLRREALKLLARSKAEIVFRSRRVRSYDLECLDVASRAIKRDHQLRDEALAIRRFLD